MALAVYPQREEYSSVCENLPGLDPDALPRLREVSLNWGDGLRRRFRPVASHGMPARVAASSRPRTVWDFPRAGGAAHERVPVQRRAGDSQFPDGNPVPVQHGSEQDRRIAVGGPSVTGDDRGFRSDVEIGRSTSRRPGSSRAGGRASIATSLEEA